MAELESGEFAIPTTFMRLSRQFVETKQRNTWLEHAEQVTEWQVLQQMLDQNLLWIRADATFIVYLITKQVMPTNI